MSTELLNLVPLPPPNRTDSDAIFRTASEGRAEDLQVELRQRALSSLYYFTKVVIGFDKLSPQFHFDRCQEIQDSIPDLKRGFLWPRGHFKSTIVTKSYPLWRLAGGGWQLAHPDLPPFDFNVPSLDPRNQRIYLSGESDSRVVNALRNMKWHLENNKLLKWLFPEICPVDVNKTLWRDDAIKLPRSIDYDEPTIRAVGVGTKVTGYHGNIFVFDDLIGEKAAASDAVMVATNDYIDYVIGLADNPKCVEWLFAGTRWKCGKADSYGKLMDEQPFYRDAETRPHGIRWFVHSAILETGEPAFPERFSISTLTDINVHLKDYKYSCQYLNTPSTPEGGDFPAALVKTFIGEGEWLVPQDGTPKCRLTDLLRISFYDLSAGGKSKEACENAIIILGTHPDKRRFALDAFMKNCGYREALENWYRLNDQYKCYKNYFEDKGAQKEILEMDLMVRSGGCELCRQRMERNPDLKLEKHRNLRMKGYGHEGFGGNKEDRVRLYMQSTVEEGRLYLNAKLAPLRVQVTSFPHYHLKDGTDSLASAVHLSRAPIGLDEAQSREIEEEQKSVPPEARVHTDRVYGGYA